MYHTYSINDANFSSKFNETGRYNLTINTCSYPGYYLGFSFKFLETYDCPLNCDKCASPLTCLACKGNSNLINSTCACPENSVYSGNKCQCNEGFSLNNNKSLYYCKYNDRPDESNDVVSNNSNTTQSSNSSVSVTNNVNVENSDNSNVSIEINIYLNQKNDEVTEETSSVELVSENNEFRGLKFVVFGFVGVLAFFFVVKALATLRKHSKSTTELEPDYQIIPH